MPTANESVRLAVYGAAGRMGFEVLRVAHARTDVQVAAALVRAASPFAGESLRSALGDGAPDLDFESSLDPETRIDVMVDFSGSDSTVSALAMAQAHRAAYVCGSTGLSREHEHRLREASAAIPVLWSANFSLGVAVLKRAVAKAAAMLGPEFEAEILEIHHSQKRDAPSGTALAIGRAIAEARKQPFEEVARFARSGTSDARTQHEIGFAVLRAADVVGEHTVIFASAGERLEFTHRANSRGIFATGAVRSAIWLAQQPPGWYDLSDVLG